MPCHRPTLTAIVVGLCAACIPPAERVKPGHLDELETIAATCDSFAAFDARLSAESERLLATEPGERLVAGAASLARARRACARHVLGSLLERRVSDGQAAVEHEIDALAHAWPPADLDPMMLAALGAEGTQALQPLVTEARARTSQTSWHASESSPAPVSPTCADAISACDAMPCVVSSHLDVPAINKRAQGCLDALRDRAPLERAKGAARLAALLDGTKALAALTETRVLLETLRLQLWPEIQSAREAQQFALAATLAAPFAQLESTRREVATITDEAISFHLDTSRRVSPRALAARLHRIIAAELGGPAEPPLASEPGHWATPRWGCSWPAPELPQPFTAVELRLSAQCRRAKQPKTRRDEPSGTLATFDLEKTLEQETVEGVVNATCANQTFIEHFSAKSIAFDGDGAERRETLLNEFSRVLSVLERQCKTARRAQLQRACTTLGDQHSADSEQLFAEGFVVTGEWEPCFVDSFTARYGVAPPRPSARH